MVEEFSKFCQDLCVPRVILWATKNFLAIITPMLGWRCVKMRENKVFINNTLESSRVNIKLRLRRTRKRAAKKKRKLKDLLACRNFNMRNWLFWFRWRFPHNKTKIHTGMVRIVGRSWKLGIWTKLISLNYRLVGITRKRLRERRDFLWDFPSEWA